MTTTTSMLQETSVLGYPDKVSVSPGEEIRFAVSCKGVDEYNSQILRLKAPVGMERSASAPIVMDASCNGMHAGYHQSIQMGSWGMAPTSIDNEAGLTLQTFIWPTLLDARKQFVIGVWDDDLALQLGLQINQGKLEAVFRRNGKLEVLCVDQPLVERKWYLVGVTYDARSKKVSVFQKSSDDGSFDSDQFYELSTDGALENGHVSMVSFAAAIEGRQSGGRRTPFKTHQHFNGKMERPRIACMPLTFHDVSEVAQHHIPEVFSDRLAGAWDFSSKMNTDQIVDQSTTQSHGTVYNVPTRAMTGQNWDGETKDWKSNAEQYGAIHFHDDDLHDCEWKFDLSLTIPDDWESGAYVLVLTIPNRSFYVPFFVRPKATTKRHIAFLAPTATYEAYSNNKARFLRNDWEASHGRLIVMDECDCHLFETPEIGLSTYDTHSDGSGVAYVSRLRPSTNTRPNGRVQNYAADLLIVQWLHEQEFVFDIVTDDDLHREGMSAVEKYDVVLTGSHPEYYTSSMMKALKEFVGDGGRLMYLGGNGFYWRCSYNPNFEGCLEVRRSESGVRAWAAESGEYYHSSDGEYGGLWSRNGAPPDALVGIGFVSQGFDSSSYYRRTEASFEERYSFVFDGLNSEIFGDDGLMGGGAAGMELDATGHHSLRPENVTVLARSEAHSRWYAQALELTTIPHAALGAKTNKNIAAEMVIFDTPKNGAVFSVGSIAFAGALGVKDSQTDCSTILTNVLNRFLRPGPIFN